jgi:hypothetical protein
MSDSELYKLEGKSREAAMRIGYILHSAINKNPISTQDYQEFLNIKKSFNQMALGVMKEKTPDLLTQAGLDKASIQVFKYQDGYPRAYTNFPQIYVNPNTPGDIYMQCPVDYKGNHFVPEDGIKIEGDEKKHISEQLFAGGWTKNAPLLEREENGIALPEDFDENNSITIDNGDGFESATVKIYKANNRSLHVIQDFLSRQESFGENVKKLFDFVRSQATSGEIEHNSQTIDASTLHADMGIAYDNEENPHVFLALINPSAQDPTQGLIIPKDTDTYLVQEQYDHRYRIIPNEETELGKEFKSFLNTVSKRPDLSDYWQLHNPTAPKVLDENGQEIDAKVPQLDMIDGEHYLIYTVDPSQEKDASAPPDGIPVSKADYLWIKQDSVDKQLGIQTPPPPKGFGGPK